MLRIVPDPGVLIAALISDKGAPASLLRRWVEGDFQFVVSPLLLTELREVADRPKFRHYFPSEVAHELAHVLELAAESSPDVTSGSRTTGDDGDAYLVHLVVSAGAFAVVTGDSELRAHTTDAFTAMTPREILDLLDRLE